MKYADSEKYKMNLDVECAKNVIKLITLTPMQVEKCLDDTFKTVGDTTSENYTLRDHATLIKVLDTHY